MNAANTLKQYIVRISPVSHSPVIFDAMSKENGQLRCVVGNEDKVVGLDFYAASIPMEDEQARQVVQAYAEKAGIPMESVVVRHRLPKTNMKPAPRTRRKTDDANLVLVHGNNKATAKAQPKEQDYRSLNEKQGKQDDLTKIAQDMQDEHDKGKASAKNPEGAVVKAADTPRTKRKYERTPKAQRSAKSVAALKRYQQEIAAAAAKSQTMEAAVQSAEQTPAAEDAAKLDEEKLAKALRLAKLLVEQGLV